MAIKTACLQIEGNLVAVVEKDESVREGGEIVPAHIQLQFLMNTDKGLEIMKVKDLESKHKALTPSTEVKIKVRVSASSMGQTYYEAI